MKERQEIIVTGFFSLLILTWLGFLVHQSPRFAGSGWGAIFGIAGAALLLLPLVYSIAKRLPSLRSRITQHVSMPTLLSWHVWTGIVGPLLAIVHTGHKYDSWLGILLTTFVMLVVVSGFAVRFLLTYVRHEIVDKLALLQTARGDLDQAWGALDNAPVEKRELPRATILSATLASLDIEQSSGGPAAEVIRLADSVADLEYAIRMHEFLKRWFSRSLMLHIALSVLLYAFLAMHVAAGIYFGLRWLQ